MGQVRYPVRKALLLMVAAGTLVLWQKMGWPCVMRSLTGLICPGCGMTRAWMAVFRLELWDAFSYNPVFWGVPVLALFWFFDGHLLGRPKLDNILLFGTIAAMAVCYILRLAALCAGFLTI